MVRLLNTALVAAAVLGTASYAQKIVADCGSGLGNCPSNKPCCSRTLLSLIFPRRATVGILLGFALRKIVFSFLLKLTFFRLLQNMVFAVLGLTALVVAIPNTPTLSNLAFLLLFARALTALSPI